MQHVNARLRDATLRNLIHAAIGCGRKSVGAVQRQLRKYGWVKERDALSIWIDLHHRAEQRPVYCILTNIEIAVGVALRGTQEPSTHLGSHVRGGGGV